MHEEGFHTLFFGSAISIWTKDALKYTRKKITRGKNL